MVEKNLWKTFFLFLSVALPLQAFGVWLWFTPLDESVASQETFMVYYYIFSIFRFTMMVMIAPMVLMLAYGFLRDHRAKYVMDIGSALFIAAAYVIALMIPLARDGLGSVLVYNMTGIGIAAAVFFGLNSIQEMKKKYSRDYPELLRLTLHHYFEKMLVFMFLPLFYIYLLHRNTNDSILLITSLGAIIAAILVAHSVVKYYNARVTKYLTGDIAAYAVFAYGWLFGYIWFFDKEALVPMLITEAVMTVIRLFLIYVLITQAAKPRSEREDDAEMQRWLDASCYYFGFFKDSDGVSLHFSLEPTQGGIDDINTEMIFNRVGITLPDYLDEVQLNCYMWEKKYPSQIIEDLEARGFIYSPQLDV